MSTSDFFVHATALMMLLAAAPSCGGGGGGGGGAGGGAGGSSGAVGSVRTLTFPAGIKGSSPRFSHDGALLAHVRYDGTNYNVAVMSTTGADARTLATDGDYLTAMAWTADDSEIFYYSTQGVRAVPLAGGKGRFIVNGFAAMDPDLSPDGKWLVYGENGATLKLVDLTLTTPVENDLGLYGRSPRFSPDGSTIAFWGDDKIQTLNLATKEVTDILATKNSFGGVDWFSDGRRLLAGTDQGIEILSLGSSIERKLLLDQFALLQVDLSPDDKSVAYGVNGRDELFVLTGF
jgi:Tol biopolymer transport system component